MGYCVEYEKIMFDSGICYTFFLYSFNHIK